MKPDRLIQTIALVVLAACLVIGEAMLPSILARSERHSLRYTNVAVEGAPPIVTLGTAIGALRGGIVTWLWIRVHLMQEQGLYFEVMSDAELITRLQPRFPQVWAFHGHNMAYNISVATHTVEERWEWVNAGIRLVRDEGLRHNPNDIVLYKELAFWLAHKIDGYSDDANLYYKERFAREWHQVLGTPPEDDADRIAWIRRIAEAPGTLAAVEERVPGTADLADRLDARLGAYEQRFRTVLGRQLLTDVAMWQAVRAQSEIARRLGYEDEFRARSPFFNMLDELLGDPSQQAQWEALLAHVRKRVLIDEYNMDPVLMYEFTRDLGPIDWRHPQAHALYWSRRGAEWGKGRLGSDDIYKILNTDRMQIQALQALARSGRISFDPFSTGVPGRFPEPRFIDSIESLFEELYVKYYDVRGGGGETFITFLQNFLGSSVREWYRSGEIEKAQSLLDRLDELFGRGALVQHNEYALPLDVFVKNQTFGEYDRQPHIAPSDISASLRYGFRIGIGRNRPEVYREALAFARQVTDYFKGNKYYDFTTKFGTGRIKDLIGALENSVQIAFLQLMTDPTVPMEERMTIWARVDRLEPALRPQVYDQLMPMLQAQFAQHPFSAAIPLGEAFPEPPGLDAWRREMVERAAREAAQEPEIAEIERR